MIFWIEDIILLIDGTILKAAAVNAPIIGIKAVLFFISRFIKTKNIRIDDNVFIGGHSIILKGSSIGKNSIIGAGSVVSGEIPANEIWGGNPAKFIRSIS